jgi:phosphohistidine phosphatase SixA
MRSTEPAVTAQPLLSSAPSAPSDLPRAGHAGQRTGLLPSRRHWMLCAGLGPLALLGGPWRPARAQPGSDPAALEGLLRSGGVVLVLRHALAPGTFDPPGFRIDDCSTQRNLNDEGREQSRRIGAWFTTRSLRPAAVRSSPWCRCVDTATLAFGAAEVWPALGSPYRGEERSNEAHRRALLQRLAELTAQPGRFEVWVTHAFVQSALAGSSTGSGEGLVLRAAAGGGAELLRRAVLL